MNVYTVVGYLSTKDETLVCTTCAERLYGVTPDGEDTHSYNAYVAGLDGSVGAPLVAVFDYQNEEWSHGRSCDTPGCASQIFEAWCDGCETCAPELTVRVENRDDDPWGCTVHVTAESPEALERWLHWKGGYIGGDTWESEDSFAYAMPSVYIGCADEWRSEGYVVDESVFSDDPLEHFAGMTDNKVTSEIARIAEYRGMRDEYVDSLRADIESWQACTVDQWRTEDPNAERGFAEWRAARVRGCRTARNA